MSTRRMVFTLAFALAAMAAAPVSAADLEPMQVTLLDIFSDPLDLPSEAAQTRSTCIEGETMWVLTGVCCSATRQLQDQYKCTGGTFVPTGSSRCFPPSCID